MKSSRKLAGFLPRNRLISVRAELVFNDLRFARQYPEMHVMRASLPRPGKLTESSKVIIEDTQREIDNLQAFDRQYQGKNRGANVEQALTSPTTRAT